MNTFFNVSDLGDLSAALEEAQLVKRDRFAFQHLGKNKTLLMSSSITLFVPVFQPRRQL